MKLLAFGEILFDVNGNERKLGGAPMNFCAHAAKLGDTSFIMSAVGEDSDGAAVLEAAKKFNISDKYIGRISEYPTGVCMVSFNGSEPSYDLSIVSAYDNISADDDIIESIKNERFDVFYMGTIAQRSEKSRNSLMKILENVKFDTVFYDMNLRQDYYTSEIIEKSLRYTDILKINRDELEFMKKEGFVCGNDMKELLSGLCGKYGIKTVIVTLDKDGAVCYSAEENSLYVSPQKKANPVSAVGAGDSFSACFLHNYMGGADLKTCLERANTMGAYVVGFLEAIPEYSAEILDVCKI